MDNKAVETVVGIDVGKLSLAVAVGREGEEWEVANNEDGLAELVETLKSIAPQLIVMEATGGLQQLAALSLSVAGFPVAVINPQQGHYFAKMTGRKVKTDKLDAKGLAHFGEVLKPEIRPIADEKQQYLQDLLSRRRQIIKMKTAEKNRYQRANPLVRSRIKKHITWLDEEQAEIEKELSQHIKNNDAWRHVAAIVRSVPGIGLISTLALVAGFPELGQLNRKEVAALLGVAPFNRDSGTQSKKRFTSGGRGSIRSILHLATLRATVCNPVIRSFYLRLLEAGKPTKVALTACMRKLIVIINAMVKHNTFWQQPNEPISA